MVKDDEELMALIEKIDALEQQTLAESRIDIGEEKELILNPTLRCRNEQE